MLRKTADPSLPGWDQTAALRAVGGEASFLDELVALYLKDAAGGIARIGRLARAGKFEDLWKESHRLKGSSLTLRLNALASTFLDLEEAARKRKMGRVAELAERAKTEFEVFSRSWTERNKP